MHGSLFNNMEKWNTQTELDITFILKEWLKQRGKTQKDLKQMLNTTSDRMPEIINVLKKEFTSGGLPQLARILCSIEDDWAKSNQNIQNTNLAADPFGQLDLLLEEIQEDCTH